MAIPRRTTPSERIAITMGRRRGDRSRLDIHAYNGELFRMNSSAHHKSAAVYNALRRRKNER